MNMFTVCSLLFYLIVSVFIVLLSIFVIYVIYVFYNRQKYSHLPQPHCSSFFFGHAHDISLWQKNGGTYGSYILEQSKKHGPIFVTHVLHHVFIEIAEPSCLKDLLFKDESFLKNKFIYEKVGYIYGVRVMGNGLVTNTDHEQWRERRQLINPVFHRKSLRTFMSDFNDVCDQFIARLQHVVESNHIVSMSQEFANVTVDIISQVSFNIKIGAIKQPDLPFVKAIASSFAGMEDNLRWPMNSTWLSILQYWPSQTQQMSIDAAKFLRDFAQECLLNRKSDIAAGVDTPKDLLDILVKDSSLSIQDMVDEFITIFMAGQETTANFLGFTLFEIIQNPDVEDRILCEIKDVLGARDNVEFEDLSKLTYLGQVMKESLRMYPVAGGTNRLLTKDMVLFGYKVPEGSQLQVSGYAFNHNPQYWEKPHQFNPDRFAGTSAVAYFPFGYGSRNCIGQVFSKFESKVVLAKILRKYKFELLPGQTSAMLERMTKAPRDGVMCKVKQRLVA